MAHPVAAHALRARIDRGEVIDVRGYGKAGGGLVLAMQAFGRALALSGGYAVEDWPLFSAARKGATVCAFIRVARMPFELACQITEPDIAILMNEAAAEEADFAEGTSQALYVVNTAAAPHEMAAKYKLGGTVVTIDGDTLGRRHLGRPLANIAILAALVRATKLVEAAAVRESLYVNLKKHRLPERLLKPNLDLYDQALDSVRIMEASSTPETVHPRHEFRGYGSVPVGAQSALRTSLATRTATYGRPGVRVEFNDPAGRCNGCSLCVVQCPESIIDFTPDPARGTIVHGARFEAYCKVCTECVAACPLDLFREVPTTATAATGGGDA